MEMPTYCASCTILPLGIPDIYIYKYIERERDSEREGH